MAWLDLRLGPLSCQLDFGFSSLSDFPLRVPSSGNVIVFSSIQDLAFLLDSLCSLLDRFGFLRFGLFDCVLASLS